MELAPFGLLGIFLLTVAWYVLRARRAGATPSFRRVAGVVLGGTAAVFVLSAFGEASWRGVGESGFLTNIVLPLGGLGLCGVAWARFGRGELRKAGGWAGAVLLALVGSLLLAVVLPERDGLLAILVGLLVLAWLERAWQPAALAVPLALATFDFVPGPPGLVPAMVLLAGALVILVTRFSPTEDPA